MKIPNKKKIKNKKINMKKLSQSIMTLDKKNNKKNKNKKESKLAKIQKASQNLKTQIITKIAVLNETFYILLFFFIITNYIVKVNLIEY